MSMLFNGYQPKIDLKKLYFNTKGSGTISSRAPSLGERVSDALRRAGVGQHQANRWGQKLTSAVEALTPIGNVTQGYQAGKDLRKGNWLQGGFGAALAVLPGAPRVKAALKGFHGSRAEFDTFDPAFNKTARDFYFAPTADDAAHYGDNIYEADIAATKVLDIRPGNYERIPALRKAFDEGGMNDWFDNFDDFVDAIDSGDMYQRFASQHAQNDLIGALQEQGYDAIYMPDAGFGGRMSESIVVSDPALIKVTSRSRK